MSFKIFCDKCEKEMPVAVMNQHDMWIMDPKLGKVRMIVIVREYLEDAGAKDKGEKILNLCVKCVRGVGRDILTQIPEPEDGEKTESELADKPEWEAP